MNLLLVGTADLDALLGLRASEIVSRLVADLDEDQEPVDLLWIPGAKTLAGRRTLEVLVELRPLLAAVAAGKARERHLFECERPHERAAHKPHDRDWVIDQVHRICDLSEVPRVTAHAMRGLLATLTAERGMAGHLIAATLGHEDDPGSRFHGQATRLAVLATREQNPALVHVKVVWRPIIGQAGVCLWSSHGTLDVSGRNDDERDPACPGASRR